MPRPHDLSRRLPSLVDPDTSNLIRGRGAQAHQDSSLLMRREEGGEVVSGKGWREGDRRRLMKAEVTTPIAREVELGARHANGVEDAPAL